MTVLNSMGIPRRTCDIIVEFALAHKDAEQNPQAMIDNPSKEVSDACVKRMERVSFADARLYDLSHDMLLLFAFGRGVTAGQPKELLNYLAYHADRGCTKCWLSSGRQHDECRVKIKRWFEGRDALIAYGLKLHEMLKEADSAKP